jgi:hypothetical protein
LPEPPGPPVVAEVVLLVVALDPLVAFAPPEPAVTLPVAPVLVVPVAATVSVTPLEPVEAPPDPDELVVAAPPEPPVSVVNSEPPHAAAKPTRRPSQTRSWSVMSREL